MNDETIERPAGAPDPSDPLLMAARYNDAEAEDHGIQGAVEKHGLDFESLRYIAEQRALRIVLLQNGEIERLRGTGYTRIELSAEQRTLVDGLTPLYLDAIFIGWRAREFANEESAA